MQKTIASLLALATGVIAGLAAAAVNVFRPLANAIEDHLHRSGLILSLITATETKGQGQPRAFHRRFLDDAATPAAVVVYPGFRPNYVCLENLTDRIKYEWYTGMAEGDYVKTLAAGTRTLETDDVLVVEDDTGARPAITVAASIVLQNKQYHLMALA